MTNLQLRRGAVLAAKIAVSVALLAFVITQSSLGQYSSIVSTLSPLTIAAVLGIAVFQMGVISAWRLKLVLGLLGRDIGALDAARVTWCGFFFEQIGAAFIAGDIARVWLLRRGDFGLREAASALLLDRVMGFIAIIAMAAFGLSRFWDQLSGYQVGLLGSLAAASVLALLTIGVLAASGKARSSILHHASRVKNLILSLIDILKSQSRWRIVGVALLALATHSLNVVAIYLLLTEAGVAVGLASTFLIAPTAFLFTMLPVSISGWGVREGAFVLGLHGFGAVPEQIIVASVVFGLCVLVAALPGAVMWLSMPGRAGASAE